jgi:hypothetical protein
MKTPNRFLIAAAALAFFAAAGQARAGGSHSCCNDSCCHDGVTASPKVRAMLDERCKSRCTPPTEISAITTHQTDVVASPKIQQMLHNRIYSPALVVTETSSYRPTGSDGVTASPRLRTQLDERRSTIEIAPLK